MRTAAHLGDAKKCAEDSNAYQGYAGNSGPLFPQGKVDCEKAVGSTGKAARPALAVKAKREKIAGWRREGLGAAEIECVPGAGHAGECSHSSVGDQAERDGDDGPESCGSDIADFLGLRAVATDGYVKTPNQNKGGDDFAGTMNPLDERNSFPCETSAWFVKHVLEPEIDVMERQYGKGKKDEQ